MKVTQYGSLIVGTFIIALCFNLFLQPNQIASGGLPGAAIVLSNLLRMETELLLLLVTITVLLVGAGFLGKTAVLSSIFASLLIPFFVYLTNRIPPLTEDPLLAAIYSGIGIGVGLGVVFRAKGNVGGFTLIAQILHKHRAVKPSTTITVLDASVIIAAGVIFSPEKALYALIAVFLTRKTMDIVLGNSQVSKMAYIISSVEFETAINQAVLYELDRGLTKLSGVGGYSKNERAIMMTVLPATKASKLKASIQQIDPTAFIIFCDATDVIGEGFSQPAPTTRFQKFMTSRA